MSRSYHGSRRDPLLIQYDRHSQPSSLLEAKLAAWAFAIGEQAPGAPPGGRKPHRGMLPDVLPPEPPGRSARPMLLARLADAIGRLFGREPAPAAAATTMSGAETPTVGDGAGITYIDRTSAAGSATAKAAGDPLPIRSRAA